MKISRINDPRTVPRRLLETALLGVGGFTLLDDVKVAVASPMENSILEIARKSGIDVQELRRAYHFKDEISFDNTRKMASYIYQNENRLHVFSR